MSTPLYEVEEREERLTLRIRMLETIGRGNFGSIRKCICDGLEEAECVGKCFCRHLLRKFRSLECNGAGQAVYVTGMGKLSNEIGIMKQIAHKNISRLLAVVDDPEEEEIALIMEYCNIGSILSISPNDSNEYVRSSYLRGFRWSAPLYLSIFNQLLRAVKYLHANNICHRDIKPDNILLSCDTFAGDPTMPPNAYGVEAREYIPNIHVQLSDFGCAVRFDEGVNPQALVSDTVGTPAFWAPESITVDTKDIPSDERLEEGDLSASKKDDPKYNSCFALDMWALGVTVCYIITMQHPFEATPSRDLVEFDFVLDTSVQSTVTAVGEVNTPMVFDINASKSPQQRAELPPLETTVEPDFQVFDFDNDDELLDTDDVPSREWEAAGEFRTEERSSHWSQLTALFDRVCTNNVPWMSAAELDNSLEILRGNIRLDAETRNRATLDRVREIVQLMLMKNPEQRLTVIDCSAAIEELYLVIQNEQK